VSEDLKPSRYEPIALSNESTVVAEFVRPDEVREERYQSEAELERDFIARLQVQAYEYLRIGSEADLIANLRRQLEALNRITFSDKEWQQVFGEKIAGANDGIIEKTARIQEDHVQVLKRDDGSTKNIYLIDKQSIHNNRLQVINQYEVEGKRANRYDVTVLVNGLPMVHIELKRRGVDIREAFNQIDRYQRDSFWAGSGLFEYVQLFVISNGTLTKYYSNTVRDGHLAEQRGRRDRKKTSNSFSFTSWWADAKNQPITELADFTKTFFAKHALLNVLTRYCVFDVDRKLLVMRPYQIVAAERILQRIATATNHRQLGTVAAGGYIWHTTGSGKTLTSFKAAQLARGLPEIDKVLFVVDRKDLDYQTMREYERFEKGAANSNTSTAVLQKQLEDANARIIITTIQKLSRFVIKNKKHPVYDADVVVIFDECHRSQFGDMHRKSPGRSSAITYSASPARRSSPTTPARAATRSCAPRSRRSATSCTPTPSSTRSTTRTCCRSASTTSTPSRPRRTCATSRCRPSTRNGAARAGAHHADRSLHPRALRPENQAQRQLPAWRQAAQRLQFAIRHGVDRRRQTLLHGVRQPAEGHPTGAAAEDRADLQLCRQRRRRWPAGRRGVRDRRTGSRLARLPRRGHQGLQRPIRHQLRHLRRQVPELLQRFVAAAQEPRARPGHRGQHVPDRLRRHHAEHAMGGQEPACARADPGVFAHQPHPQFGQDLRQHRFLP
jgi:hypothetical protein